MGAASVPFLNTCIASALLYEWQYSMGDTAPFPRKGGHGLNTKSLLRLAQVGMNVDSKGLSWVSDEHLGRVLVWLRVSS